MIIYVDTAKDISKEQLSGFFVGWPNPPSQKKHLEILSKSAYVWLAVDDETNQVVGFINAISDRVLSAYIPLLEVLPNYQKQGIGGQLVKKMLDTLSEYYMVDLLCDEEMQAYYDRYDMYRAKGMIQRHYNMQSGRSL